MSSVYFTKEHEWVKVDGNIGVVGISNHAAHELGDITFVELPQPGKDVRQFDVLAAIESVKAASDIYAPLSGRVVKTNGMLDTTPEIVNESAEGTGWLAEMELSDPSEVSKLMTADQYADFLKTL